VISRYLCAGLNRYEAENAKFLQGRSSDPLWPRVLRWASRGARRSVNRGIGGVGHGAAKRYNPDADAGNMWGRQHGQGRWREPWLVRRSRRPQARLRNFIPENRETWEAPVVEPDCRTAGEGSGHTARVNVCEGSHCGIVPMNQSNKDGTSSAESEEGRLRIKENAGQSNRCPTQSGEAGVSQGLTGVRTSGLLCLAVIHPR